MKTSDLDRFDVIITPKGIRRRALTIPKMLDAAYRTFVKVVVLVQLSLHQQAFGLSLGHLWLILEPTLQAATYFFLIRFVLGVSGQDMTFAFFFTAITFWRSHASLVTAAPYLLAVKGQTYLEQNMSLETAYLETIVGEVVLFLLRLVVLAFFLLAAGTMPSWTWVFSLVIGVVVFSFSSALVLWLSVIGLFLKDVGKIVGHVVWLWWYMSPGLYTINRIPDWFLPIYKLNPFAHIMPALHTAILDGKVPNNLTELFLIFVGSIVLTVTGWRLVTKSAYSVARFT